MKRPGYTLLELMLVMAIIVFLATLAYPSMAGLSGPVKLNGAADAVRSAWAQARAKAVEEGRPYRFAVVPGKGNFRIAPDSEDSWNGGEASGPDGPGLVQEEALPPGVCFSRSGEGAGPPPGNDTVLPPGSVSPGQWSKVVVFNPDGTASEDVEILFQFRNLRPLRVHLRALTGGVKVQQSR